MVVFRRKRFHKRRFQKRHSTKKIVKSAMTRMVESKFFTNIIQDASLDSAGVLTSMSDITVGTGDQNRIGDQVYVKSIECFFVNENTTVAGSAQYVRLIIFQWTATTVAAAPTVGQILQTPVWDQPHNHDERFNFKILYDKFHKVLPTMIVNGVGPVFSQDVHMAHFWIRRIPKRRIQYLGGGTEGTNKIYCIMICDADEESSVSFRYRLNYTDL